MNRVQRLLWAIASVLIVHSGVVFASSPNIWINDNRLVAPKATNFASQYAHFGLAGESLATGSVVVQFPLELLHERGAVLHNPIPAYSHRAPLSEWGKGWDNSLRIYRYSDLGEVDCNGETFASPWGKLKANARGNAFYPLGLEVDVRIVRKDNIFVAYHPDGRVFEFGGDGNVFGAGKSAVARYLRSVVDKEGHRTSFIYEKNQFGRPLLKQVLYGGKKRQQYVIDIEYEDLASPILAYESCGLESTINKRVSTIVLRFWNGKEYALHKTVRLTHYFANNGAVFYLTKIETEFASGARLPAFTYGYDGYEKYIEKPYKQVHSELQSALKELKNKNVYGQSVAFVDFNQDGLMDIERADNLQSYLQTNSTGEFKRFTLYSNLQRDQRCPPYGPFEGLMPYGYPRRLLIRPSGINDQLYHLVLANDSSIEGTLTKIRMCSLEGQVVYEKEHFARLESGYAFDKFTHLADINNDGKPDLIRVAYGRYTYFLNESKPGVIKFADAVTKELPKIIDRVAKHFAFADINGDGLVDLVAQARDGLWVWYGKGNQIFGPQETHYPFQTALAPWVNVHDAALTYLDINRDGLMDVVFHRWHNAFVFINEGHRFFRYKPESFENRPPYSSDARVVGLNGTFDDQLTMFGGVIGLISYDLNGPSTGLLTSINDGQGISVDIAYSWTAPVAGVPRPFTVPDSISVTVAGQGITKTQFTYGEPKINSLNGQLIGFSLVETLGAQTVSRLDFLTSVNFPPKVKESTRLDKRRPHLSHVETSEWLEADEDGVYYPRRFRASQAYVNSGVKHQSSTIEYLEYSRLCATKTRAVASAGVVETFVSYFFPVLWSEHHGCLIANQTRIGRHEGQPALDFTQTVLYERNANGLPIGLDFVLGDERIRQTTLSYDDEMTLRSAEEPSSGRYELGYNAEFDLLNTFSRADGSSYQAQYDPDRPDSIAHLQINRGESGSWAQSFAYDDYGRLAKSWNSLTTSSEAKPVSSYEYRFASETAPASVTEQVSGNASVVSFALADGEEILRGYQSKDRSGYGRLLRKTPDEGRTIELETELEGRSAKEITFADLGAASKRLSETSSSALWNVLKRWFAIDSKVSNLIEQSIDINSAGVSVTSQENNAFTSRTILDPISAKLKLYEDELGRRYEYVYDVDERLREVRLPDGIIHRAAYDGLGRLSRIDHSVAGSISYVYDNTFNRLAQKIHAGPDGSRIESFEYDQAGQISAHTYSRGLEREHYEMSYSGGLLREVKHNEFTKSFVYTPDALPLRKQIVARDNPALSLTFKYDGYRHLAEQAVEYGCNTYTKIYSYDGFHRVSSIQIGDQVFKTTRDAVGKVQSVTLPDGRELHVLYDPLTKGRIGHALRSAEGREAASHRWFYDDRGLVVSTETFNGLDTLSSRHQYNPDKTLQHAGVLNGNALPEHELSPHGRIARVISPSGSLQYIYDENLHRVAKYRNSNLEYLRLDDVVFANAHLYEKIFVDGIDLGVLVDGKFVFCIFDQVGSMLSFGESFSLPSPFGERQELLPVHEFLDYAGHGRDPDTGLISMGERDYDPRTHRFISADLLFLESPERCVRSPKECDLFSYAQGNPLFYVDPSGNIVDTIADVGFVLWDVYELVTEPSWTNAAALGLDVAATFIPCVTGLGRGAKAGLEAVKHSDDALKLGAKATKHADEAAGTVSRNLKYEPAPYHGKTDNPVKSKGPTNGQAALENSVQVTGNSPRRIGIDPVSREFVVFSWTQDVLFESIFHGHVRTWTDLLPVMQNALRKSGLVDKRGNILGGK